MNNTTYQREIRDSIIRELLKKVREQRYKEYLTTIRLEKIRFFQGAKINFDFPVTALIGPNGSGKSTILGVSACIYSSISPDNVFIKSRVGDESMDAWKIEYEIIDKTIKTPPIIAPYRAELFNKKSFINFIFKIIFKPQKYNFYKLVFIAF